MLHWEQSFISQKYGTAAFRPKKVTQKTSPFFGVARLDAQPWVFPYNSRFLWIRQEVYIQFLLIKSLFLLVYVIPMFVAETCWNYHLLLAKSSEIPCLFVEQVEPQHRWSQFGDTTRSPTRSLCPYPLPNLGNICLGTSCLWRSSPRRGPRWNPWDSLNSVMPPFTIAKFAHINC